ncbi:iron chelate uptake ABC transporter family permease subunit [Streptosporangiaceae bacterium NEAU-GS5]|nr:iron chelate uptake ABC transporter family permease subunit [Streptosporangiaceae bacterium NEAU-GS5]
MRGPRRARLHRPRPAEEAERAVKWLLVAAAVAVSLVALATGEYALPISDLVAALAGRGTPATEFVVTGLRAPRVASGVLVGAAFGLSGALFQSLTRNPLGSPDFLGFTAGAATGGIVAVVRHGSPWAVAAGAVLGCVLTALAVQVLSRRGRRLVLVGVGVGALLSAANSYLLTQAGIWESASAAAWLTGSLSGRGWEQVIPLAAVLALLIPVCGVLSRPLRMMEMGDDAAKALGVPVEATRRWTVAAGVALVGAGTAAAGPVAFLALVAPHLARRITRAPGVTLTASALTGAVLLVAADVAAQRVIAPGQLPAGVMTAAIGGVYLAFLLRKDRR